MRISIVFLTIFLFNALLVHTTYGMYSCKLLLCFVINTFKFKIGEENKNIKCKEHIDAALKQYWDHEKDDDSREATLKSSIQDTKEDDSREKSNIKVAEVRSRTGRGHCYYILYNI